MMNHVVIKPKSFSLITFAVIVLVLAIAVPSYAQPPGIIPFKVKAKSAVLMNARSGQVVFEQRADVKIPPASLTKLMTLYIVFDAVDNGYVTLSDQVKISKKAWKTIGSRMFLEVGTQVELKTMLQGIAVVSANDACVAVGEYVAGAEATFVEDMNEKAAAIGMNNTVFTNSHGLPEEGQYSSARDMALLAFSYLKNHPGALKMHSRKQMTFNGIKQQNRNGLLWLDYGVDGLKTGWFSDAGFHIIATAFRNQDRFIAVVMGADGETQRENAALKLLNLGFRNFRTVSVPREQTVTKISVWKGARADVDVAPAQEVCVTLSNKLKGEVYIEKDVPERLVAPVAHNSPVGQLRVIVGEKTIKTFPLLPLDPVGRAGMIKRCMHGMVLSCVVPPYWGVITAVVLIVVFFAARRMMSGKRKKEDIFDLS